MRIDFGHACVFYGVLLACVRLLAAPFTEWIETSSPKGTPVRIWGEGDEFSAFFEAEDGHTVLFDNDRRAYVYAEKDVMTGGLLLTDIVVGEETPVDVLSLAAIPLHLRDASSAEVERRESLLVEDERIFGTQKRWGEMKERYRRRRTAARDSRTASLMSAEPSQATSGRIVGLTLLIDFPVTNRTGAVVSSLAATSHPDVTVQKLDELINGENCTLWGNASSVRKYYEDVSCGKVCYTNIVLGWFMAKYPREYYDNPTQSNGTCARPLIGEILKQIVSASDYQSKYLPLLRQVSYSDNHFLALNVFFAGPSSPVWSKGLWAHKSNLQFSQYSSLGVPIEGSTKYFNTYQISPVTSRPSIGTFCHENGHMVCGFPDLYSYDSGYGKGVGSFCLMCSHGSTAIQYICPYLRAIAGWIEPKEMPSSPSTLTVSNRLDDVWKFSNPSDPNQYYLVENRQCKGRDAILPGGGILIWRCDEKGDNRSPAYLPGVSGIDVYRRSNEVSLEQADGRYELEREINSGDSGDPWYQGNPGSRGVFSDTTVPCARWRNGDSSGLLLAGFSAKGDVMRFEVGRIPPKTYRVSYSLCGGKCSQTLPDTVPYDTIFSLPTPVRTGYLFEGWSVSGADASTAVWGVGTNPSAAIVKSTDKCRNEEQGTVYFRNLTPVDGGTVIMYANWKPNVYPPEKGDLYVSEIWGSDSNDGGTWKTAFASIRKAVSVATSGQRIVVHDGHYEPFSVSQAIPLSIVSVNGADRTIVDGALEWGDGVSNRCANLKGTYQSVEGFTLENGRATSGGGSYNGTLRNCILRANVAVSNGGGSYYGTLSNCVFIGNSADASGGGAYNGTLYYCRFQENRAKWGGGSAWGTARGCVYQLNSAGTSGGGAYSGNLYNSLFCGNDAGWGGGCYTGKIWNCTLVQNSASHYGGAAAMSVLANCVAWDNVAGLGPNLHYSTSRYTCTAPLADGEGNISKDPQFFDPATGNYRLGLHSPCIDVGSSAESMDVFDLDGCPRIGGSRVDMGAYESGGSTWSTPLPVPYRWLENYPDILRGQENDYERTAREGLGANGHALWKCYAIGLNPMDADARLTAQIEMKTGIPIVTWSPARPEWTPQSWYQVEGKTSLDNPLWSFPSTSAHRFFRVVFRSPDGGR